MSDQEQEQDQDEDKVLFIKLAKFMRDPPPVVDSTRAILEKKIRLMEIREEEEEAISRKRYNLLGGYKYNKRVNKVE